MEYIETLLLSGAFAFILALVHFLGEELEEFTEGFREQIVSFSSGVSITYIFMELIPEFIDLTPGSNLIFAAPLFGFSSIHLAEKLIAKKDISQERAREDYAEIHSIFLFLYHGAIGFLLASLVAKDAAAGLLFFVPILFHSSISSFSFSELHEDTTEMLWIRLVVSLAPLIGVGLHWLDIFSSTVFAPLFGLVIGMFIYVVVRDSIPSGDSGKPVEYLLGVGLYLLAIILLNTF